jgi:hypothetical protein
VSFGERLEECREVRVCGVWEGGKTGLHYGICIQYVTHGQEHLDYMSVSGVPRNVVRWVQQIQLRTEGRENGDLGGGSPLVRGSVQFAIRFDFIKLSGCRVLLRMYFPRNWEFGSALSKLRNFGGWGV